jgi:hypothetical protein
VTDFAASIVADSAIIEPEGKILCSQEILFFMFVDAARRLAARTSWQLELHLKRQLPRRTQRATDSTAALHMEFGITLRVRYVSRRDGDIYWIFRLFASRKIFRLRACWWRLNGVPRVTQFALACCEEGTSRRKHLSNRSMRRGDVSSSAPGWA